MLTPKLARQASIASGLATLLSAPAVMQIRSARPPSSGDAAPPLIVEQGTGDGESPHTQPSTLPTVLDRQGINFDAFGVTAVPTGFLIDDGVVAGAHHGGIRPERVDAVIQWLAGYEGRLDTACGRAALIQLYRELGFDRPPRSLPEPDPRMGLSLLQLQEAASKDHVGLNGERLDTGELEDLPYPFIAWFDRNHFVVVEEMTEDGRVSVLDPAIGRVLYYPKLLQLHWDGTALVPRESEGRS
jgi:hypothetical protein